MFYKVTVHCPSCHEETEHHVSSSGIFPGEVMSCKTCKSLIMASDNIVTILDSTLKKIKKPLDIIPIL